MFLRRFLTLEFGAIFFSILHFYLANYAGSFKLMGLSEYVEASQNLAYVALALALLFASASIWINKKTLLRSGNADKIVLILALCILLYVITKNIGVILSLPIGLILVNTKDRDIFQYLLYSSIVLYSLTVILYLIGFINGGDKIDTPLFDSKENVQHLYSLGFNNPNVAYRFFLPILLSSLYLYGQRRRIILILSMLSIAIGVLTGSTAGLIIAIVACIGFVFIRRKSFQKTLKRIAPYAFIILTITSFAIATLFGTSQSTPNPVNDGLTGRPYLWNMRIENGSYLNLLGYNDEFVSNKFDEGGSEQLYYALDNTYIFLMVHYGIVIYLVYLWVYLRSAKIIKDEKILFIGLLSLLFLTVERSDFISNIYLLFAVKYLALYYLNRKHYNEKI